MVYIKRSNDTTIREMCAKGKMTPDKIAEMASTSSGRAKLDRYSNERHQEIKHVHRMYGKIWDGKDMQGRLYKDINNPEDIR